VYRRWVVPPPIKVELHVNELLSIVRACQTTFIINGGYMSAIRNKIVCLVLCAVLSFIVVPIVGAEEAPADVVKAAQEGLPHFLAGISQKNASGNPSSIKARLGFNEKDILDRAYLGEPFRYYLLGPDAVKDYVKGSNVSLIISPVNEWFFPVLIDNEAKSVLSVAKMKGVWKAVSFGKAVLSKELVKIRQVWPTEKGYAPILIASLQGREVMFSVPQVDSKNLTIIPLLAKKDMESKDYSKLEDSAAIIEIIRPRIISERATPDAQ
jgi:hypothetical protein